MEQLNNDLTGKKFGRWTVLYKTNKRSSAGCILWHCRCECGTERDVEGTRLRNGKALSCGCLRKEKAAESLKARAEDLTGKKFNRWTVLYRSEHTNSEKKGSYWHCRCECGKERDVLAPALKNGTSKSCGCLSRELASQRLKGHIKDLTGQRFGKLIALYPTNKKGHDGSTVWHCKCNCGNEIDVESHRLLSGHTKSCGCLKQEVCYKKKDITGQRFGKLTALYLIERPDRTGTIWHCRCDCGNECDYNLDQLMQGHVTSCGCETNSKGVVKIKKILNKESIDFITEKTFDNCRFPDTDALARYDFYLPKLNILIEFDGQQHFFPVGYFGGEEAFKKTQKRDEYKNEYARQYGYTLIRIPFFEEDNINTDILLGKVDKYIICKNYKKII